MTPENSVSNTDFLSKRNTENKLFRGCRFLIIEDDPDISEFFKDLFSSTQEGAEEVIVCRRIEEIPDNKNSFSAIIANAYTIERINFFKFGRNGASQLRQKVEKLRRNYPGTPLVITHPFSKELTEIAEKIRPEAAIVYPFELENFLGTLVQVIDSKANSQKGKRQSPALPRQEQESES